jgi:ppGpp synthetase/RelA/SpoT-type nucleotidyltranferase
MGFTNGEFSQYYSYMAPLYSKAIEDVLWSLRQSLEKDLALSDVVSSTRVKNRVKPDSSLLRKCRRDNIQDLVDIPSEVEDVLGIRVATLNKEHARVLFERLQAKKDSWFCKVVSQPKFTPYTISDKNNYSLKSGYQAYHVTFVYDRDYRPITETAHWPVEIQIMPQLWEFWAEYSRKYFYNAADTTGSLLPYNVIISRLLDVADDLMIATSAGLAHTSGAPTA